MLGSALVHPERKEVIPLIPEIISRQDGSTKNDCELNASRRSLIKFREEHPHLKVVVTQDGSVQWPVYWLLRPWLPLSSYGQESDIPTYSLTLMKESSKLTPTFDYRGSKSPDRFHYFHWLNGLPHQRFPSGRPGQCP